MHNLIANPTDPVEAAKAAAISVARGIGPETVEERLALDGHSSQLPSEAAIGDTVDHLNHSLYGISITLVI